MQDILAKLWLKENVDRLVCDCDIGQHMTPQVLHGQWICVVLFANCGLENQSVEK